MFLLFLHLRYFMRLSIIIPIFNVEETLERCLESVLRQSFQNYEVILIDDGSKDNSRKIAKQFMKSDDRFSLISQSNQGLSAARNVGLELAKGEYVTFIDSDDFIDENLYERLMPVLEKHPEYDFLEYSVKERYGSPHSTYLMLKDREYQDMDVYWLESKAYCHTYACNKIYKRELFSEVRFPIGKNFEDVFTLPLLLKRCKVVATTSLGTYYYCYNPNGITGTAKGRDLKNLLQAHLQYLRAGNKTDATYYAHILNIQLDVFEATNSAPIIPILPYHDTLKLKLLHLIGIKNLCRLNRFIHRISKNH